MHKIVMIKLLVIWVYHTLGPTLIGVKFGDKPLKEPNGVYFE